MTLTKYMRENCPNIPFIEANERSQIIGPQLSFQKGIKKEVLEIMSKMDLFIE